MPSARSSYPGQTHGIIEAEQVVIAATGLSLEETLLGLSGGVGADIASKSGLAAGTIPVAARAVFTAVDAPSGIVSRQLDNILDERHSFRWFGATGNGSTDDTVAIRKAIDYSSAHGAIVEGVPGDTYLCNANLTSSPDGLSYIFLINKDNVRINLRKSTIRTTVNARQWLFGGHYKPGAAFARDDANYGGAPYTLYAVNAASKWAMQLTLTTSGDAANFAVGDWVLIRTGQTLTSGSTSAHPFGLYTQIIAKSSATLMFRDLIPFAMAQLTYPVGHALAGQNAPWGIINLSTIDSLLKNWELTNGFLRGGPSLTVPLISGNQSVGSVLRDLDIETYGHCMSAGWTHSLHSNLTVRLLGTSSIGHIVWSNDAGNSYADVNGLYANIPNSTGYLHLHEGNGPFGGYRIKIRNGVGASNSNTLASIRNYTHDTSLVSCSGIGNAVDAMLYADSTVTALSIEDTYLAGSGPGRGVSIETTDYVDRNIRTTLRNFKAKRVAASHDRVTIYMPPSAFVLSAGTPVLSVLSSRYTGWALDGTSDEAIVGNVEIPGDWQSVYIRPIFATTGAGNVRIQCELRALEDGTSTSGAAVGTLLQTTTLAATTVTPAAITGTLTLPATPLESRKYQVRVNRNSSNAGDTIDAVDVWILGVELIRYE